MGSVLVGGAVKLAVKLVVFNMISKKMFDKSEQALRRRAEAEARKIKEEK